MSMLDLPTGRQTFDFDCGAKALQLVFMYYGIDIREDELMTELKTDETGTRIENMISAAERRGFQAVARCEVSLETVKEFVDAKHPVIVLVQAWADRYMALEDWKQDYDHGHYVIVIGYSGNILVFEDPGSIRRTWLTEEEFLARWHDRDHRTQQKLEHFAIVLLGKQPAVKTMERMK
jgi:ABC-type bacteriocin/lantibiotic exporter with double-glycine peptidase domain